MEWDCSSSRKNLAKEQKGPKEMHKAHPKCLSHLSECSIYSSPKCVYYHQVSCLTFPWYAKGINLTYTHDF